MIASLKDLGLSKRARQVLQQGSFSRWVDGDNYLIYLDQLSKVTPEELMQIQGCGRGTVKEINQMLWLHGFKLSS